MALWAKQRRWLTCCPLLQQKEGKAMSGSNCNLPHEERRKLIQVWGGIAGDTLLGSQGSWGEQRIWILLSSLPFQEWVWQLVEPGQLGLGLQHWMWAESEQAELSHPRWQVRVIVVIRDLEVGGQPRIWYLPSCIIFGRYFLPIWALV